MTIYIVQIPHQSSPRAWVADTEADALDFLNATRDRPFDDLDDAVSHDMHAGIWSESKADLIERVQNIPHQMLAAIRAIKELPDD